MLQHAPSYDVDTYFFTPEKEALQKEYEEKMKKNRKKMTKLKENGKKGEGEGKSQW